MPDDIPEPLDTAVTPSPDETPAPVEEASAVEPWQPTPSEAESEPVSPVADETAITDTVPEEPVPAALAADATSSEAPPSDAVPTDPETPEPAAEEAPVEEEKPNNKRWYVVKVQSGREESIKDAIIRKVRIEGLDEFFGQILIPVERVQELRRGKRVTKSHKLYPGYLFAEVEFNDRILYLFRETSGVGDFVGGGPLGKAPTPMQPAEVERMLNIQAEPVKTAGGAETTEKPAREVVRTRPRFAVGDRLRVIDGNFSGMEGEVIDITDDKVKLQVLVLGMPVTLDLDFWQVETA